MRFSLRQIQVFLATAHHQNVSRAAEQLALSQSAASGALKDLEQQFDVQLFDRIGKRLQLNEQGRQLRAKAEALLEMAKEIEEELTLHEQPGNLDIGATLTIGNYLCVDLIERYRVRAPKAHINLNIANTETIKRELLNFDIDVGMLEGEIQHPDLDIKPWQADVLTCVCSPSHPLAKHSTVSTEMLAKETWILRETGSGTRQTFDRAMHGQRYKLNIALELEQSEAIKRAVSKNLGLSCLSELVVADELSRGELVALPTPQLDLSRTLYIAVHRKKYLNSSLGHWLELAFSNN